MRLLNIHSLEIEEFFDEDIPPYCILSHRWGEQEVSFKDYRKKQNLDGPGYRKIINFCKFARGRRVQRTKPPSAPIDGPRDNWYIVETPVEFKWVWMDTCCIDKRSSSELSEAINSIYSWYENALECFVYLVDVPDRTLGSESLHISAFGSSLWFKRGWTLQELLAPEVIVFCNTDWDVLGHVCGDTWCSSGNGVGHDYTCGPRIHQEVSSITKVPSSCLSGSFSRKRDRTSVAQRMSWASGRETKRVEDQAYSLLGLFNLNMPLIYGEGKAAFFRLQQEIIKASIDHSIFAWLPHTLRQDISIHHDEPLFAQSPADFATAGNVEEIEAHKSRTQPYAMTNKGLEMKVDLIPISVKGMERRESFFVALNCTPGEVPLQHHSEEVSSTVVGDGYKLILIKLQDPSDDVYGRISLREGSIIGVQKDVLVNQVIYIDTRGVARRPSKLRKQETTAPSSGSARLKPALKGGNVRGAEDDMVLEEAEVGSPAF